MIVRVLRQYRHGGKRGPRLKNAVFSNCGVPDLMPKGLWLSGRPLRRLERCHGYKNNVYGITQNQM